MVEDLRLATLSRAALHQAQLDVHYLRLALRRYVGIAPFSRNCYITCLGSIVHYSGC